MINLEKLSKRQTIVLSTILAMAGAGTTVFLTKLVDSAFPSSFILRQQSYNTDSRKMYSIEYSSRSDGKQFLGMVTQYPIWYYSMSIGNTMRKNTGTINVTIDFPCKMKTIWALLGDRTAKARNSDSIHFQVSQLTPSHGLTFSVAIASLDLPDINKIKICVTSSAGEFDKIPAQHYRSIFTEAEN